MTDCVEYRRALLADPRSPTPQMRRHVLSCAECTRYTERVLRFDDRLRLALEVGLVPGRPGSMGRTPSLARPGTWRRPRAWLAMAASVVLALVAGGGLWLGAPGRSLAAAVVDHMAEEPDAWARSPVAVPEGRLKAVLRESGLRFKGRPGLVSYANSCLFRGHQVPHLVVQTAAGPVTVMVLTHEAAPRMVHFDEQGYRGEILPVPGHGSLAVLTRAGMQDVPAVADAVLAALDYQPAAGAAGDAGS